MPSINTCQPLLKTGCIPPEKGSNGKIDKPKPSAKNYYILMLLSFCCQGDHALSFFLPRHCFILYRKNEKRAKT